MLSYIFYKMAFIRNQLQENIYPYGMDLSSYKKGRVV